MIGGREDRPDDTMIEDRGPMDHAVRLSSPATTDPPVRVERYGQTVVVRYTWPDGDVTQEAYWPSEAKALHAYVTHIAHLIGRGYARVNG